MKIRCIAKNGESLPEEYIDPPRGYTRKVELPLTIGKELFGTISAMIITAIIPSIIRRRCLKWLTAGFLSIGGLNFRLMAC
jgi:hypothetical protein